MTAPLITMMFNDVDCQTRKGLLPCPFVAGGDMVKLPVAGAGHPYFEIQICQTQHPPGVKTTILSNDIICLHTEREFSTRGSTLTVID